MKIDVCVGARCTMKGSQNILYNLEELQEEILPTLELPEDFELEITMSKCGGRCGEVDVAPLVTIDGVEYPNANAQTIMSLVMEAIKGA